MAPRVARVFVSNPIFLQMTSRGSGAGVATKPPGASAWKTCVATAAPLSVRKPTKPAPKEGPVVPGVRLPESRPVVSSVSCLPRSAAQAAAQGASTSSHLRYGATVGVL